MEFFVFVLEQIWPLKQYGATIISKLVWWKWTCCNMVLNEAFSPVEIQ